VLNYTFSSKSVELFSYVNLGQVVTIKLASAIDVAATPSTDFCLQSSAISCDSSPPLPVMIPQVEISALCRYIPQHNYSNPTRLFWTFLVIFDCLVSKGVFTSPICDFFSFVVKICFDAALQVILEITHVTCQKDVA